ncbi:zincin-like metallopeptidase domain-containing protein [Sphingobium sp. DEHP117]|uniref:zincin-like metallopeptidase domain-containing protein n=1 Tax=Sphingobium sp. DEHP117 TaxID=2993436 RepID=UPI0027D4B69F|nr:zincin-like metallopeptidase domain-containing protein [Sphingobium sp. DEHP117]MDQ4421229.1 zincin-like metallopeptidase domain-containing protein [Sphingobium sp. DEHP117]
MVFFLEPRIGAGLSGYVAELGAAFLCGDLGISAEPRPDHAAYIDNWLALCSPRHNLANREVSIM